MRSYSENKKGSFSRGSGKRKQRQRSSFQFKALVIFSFIVFAGIFSINVFISHNGLHLIQKSSSSNLNDNIGNKNQILTKLEKKEMELVELKSQAAALKVDLSQSHQDSKKRIELLKEKLRHLNEDSDKDARNQELVPESKQSHVQGEKPQMEKEEAHQQQNQEVIQQEQAAKPQVNNFPSKPEPAKVENVHHTTSGAVCLGKDTTLLIICHDRADYLKRTLEAVLKYHPGEETVPIVISQDGQSPQVVQVIQEMQGKLHAKHPQVKFFHVQHQQESNLRGENGYVKLSQHFKWAFTQVFSELTPEANRIIILEEDLEIAPDFFEMFGALHHLLDTDPSLLAISAWNDNGQEKHVQDPQALYRADFFPGLGWMTTRAIWEELKPKWPKGYWDDWLREPPQRKGRHTIRPEICRTYHFGEQGTSNMQYGSSLRNIKLNDQFVPFGQMDLSYLEEDRWDQEYIAKVRSVKEVSAKEVKDNKFKQGHEPVRVTYRGIKDFAKQAKLLGVMENEKAGVPRTAYKYVVDFWKNGVKVYISPPLNYL